MGYGESNGHVTDDVTWPINVKKLQFNHVLTATRIDWHIENSKNDKKGISAAKMTLNLAHRSVEVINFGTSQKRVYIFLLVVNSNSGQ